MEDKKSVLFVEDEVALSQIMTRHLENNFDVIPALNGKDALRFLNANKIDCILLDLELPCINGIEVLRTIRSRRINTPVIIVTGKSCQKYAEEAADLGIQGYIIKPYDPHKLTERIKKLTDLSRRADDGGNVFQQDLHPKLKEVLQFISDNYEKELSINSLSKTIGISYSHLGNLFRDEIGMSFTCYLNRLRIGKAKELIRKTDLSISEIMYKVGFQTEQHFFKQFKRFAGVTPSSLRKRKTGYQEIVE